MCINIYIYLLLSISKYERVSNSTLVIQWITHNSHSVTALPITVHESRRLRLDYPALLGTGNQQRSGTASQLKERPTGPKFSPPSFRNRTQGLELPSPNQLIKAPDAALGSVSG